MVVSGVRGAVAGCGHQRREHEHTRLQWSSGNTFACGARGPRIHTASVNHIGSSHGNRLSWHPAPAKSGLKPPCCYTADLDDWHDGVEDVVHC